MAKVIPPTGLDLLENGLDFISSSLDPILKSELEIELKYSILHLSAGVELIIKEILRKEHWSLIFQNVDKADSSSLASGDFISVNNETALNRLQNICKVKLNQDTIRHLGALRKKRNKIEHFAFRENEFELKSISSEVLMIILGLIDKNIDTKDISFAARINISNIKRKSAEFKEFNEKALSKCKDKIKEYSKKYEILQCPNCFQRCFVINEDLKCLFCNYSNTPEQAARSYIENVQRISEYVEVTQGGYFPLDDCPECGSNTVISESDSYLCFNCLSKWDEDVLERCGACNSLYKADRYDMGYCKNCQESIFASWGENEEFD